MKLKTILLLVGGVLLVAALVLAALLIPVRTAGEPQALSVQTAEADKPEQEGAPVEENTTVETTTEQTTTEQTTTEQSVSTITFPAADGLIITADYYPAADATAPFIILFHQANYSRGEYLEIAPKLVALGYNCLAVDQRSGGATNGVKNETFLAAKAQKLATGYTDAYADLEAALSYVVSTYAPTKLLVWGSSYSSSLVLILASEHPDEIAAVLSFSPGEYFKLDDKQIADYAKNITQPVFITSAKSEEKAWRGIADQITSAGSVFFVPQANGRHGSSTLYEKTPNHAEYWTAVEAFLASLQ